MYKLKKFLHLLKAQGHNQNTFLLLSYHGITYHHLLLCNLLMRLLKKMVFNYAYIPIVLAFGSNSGEIFSLFSEWEF